MGYLSLERISIKFLIGWRKLKDVKEVDFLINLLIVAKPIIYMQFEIKSARCLKEYVV